MEKRTVTTGTILRYLSYVCHATVIVLLLIGSAKDANREAKTIIVLEVLAWFTLLWGHRRSEEEKSEAERIERWKENFVPVCFSGYILGYGDATQIMGHVHDRKTFFFPLPDNPKMIYDVPVMNCFGEFERRTVFDDDESRRKATEDAETLRKA